MKHSNHNAFTLIELLVVIAIIAILATILMPSLSRASQMAKMVACGSNLKGQLTAVRIYSTDHDGLLPKSRYFSGMNVDDGYVNTVPGSLIREEFAEPKLFYCPSNSDSKDAPQSEFGNWTLNSYGYSTEFFCDLPIDGTQGKPYFSLPDIEASCVDAPKTVMIADASGWMLDTGKQGGAHGNPNSHFINPYIYGGIYFRGRARHMGGVEQMGAWTFPAEDASGGMFNFGFGDGHVEQIDEKEFLAKGWDCANYYFITE